MSIIHGCQQRAGAWHPHHSEDMIQELLGEFEEVGLEIVVCGLSFEGALLGEGEDGGLNRSVLVGGVHAKYYMKL